MLKQSIFMNLSVVEPLEKKLKTSVYFTLCAFMFFSFCFLPRDGMMAAAVLVAAVGTGIIAGIVAGIFRMLFHQSLFGEDAYTYMLFPLSSKSVVWGKVITAGYYLLWNLLIFGAMWLFLYYWWRDFEIGVTSWDLDLVEQLTEDMVTVGKILFGQKFGAGAVTFLIGSTILQMLLGTGLLCSGVQLCCILNHLYNPNGKKTYVTALLGLGFAGTVAGCFYLPTKIFCLISDGFITMLPLVISMGLEVVLISYCVRWSVRLLQTRYALN